MNGVVNDDLDSLRAALAAGDPAGFAAMYDQLGGALLAVAARLLGNRSDAEDAVQELFVSLAASRAALARANDVRAYVFAALRHAAARIGRRRRPGPSVDDLPAPAEGSDSPAEDVEALRRAIAALPPAQREVVTLRLDAELTFEQVARVLAISPNTAASRYRYALQKLRVALGGNDVRR